MRRILAGFLLALLIGVPAIYFAVPGWAEHRARQQVDTTFDSLRGPAGKATHGTVSYDVWRRTLKIADVAIESADSAAVKFTAAQILAKGASSPTGRMEADRIEITNGEIAGLQLGRGGPRTTYRAPKIVIEKYSGPTTFERRTTAIAGAESMLAIVEAVAATNAAEISVPTLSATVTIEARPNDVAEYGLTDLKLSNMSAGHIGAATIDHIVVTGGVPEIGAYAAEMEKFAAADIDIAAMIPVLDPSQRKDDSYRTIYRTVASGPYRISFNKAASIQFDALQLDGFAIRPSKFSDPAILALSNGLGVSSPTSPAEARAMAEKLATVYEGVRIGKFEARGFDAHIAPLTASKIAAIRLTGMEDGHLAEFAIEGVDAQFAPGDPVKIGRAAIKGIDLAKIARKSAEMQPGVTPSGAQALSLLSMFEGFELDGVLVPARIAGPPTKLETLSASWGNFVNSIPTQLHVTSKIKAAIDPDTSESGLRYFADRNIRELSVSLDFGATWNEATQTLLVSPVSANIPGFYDASAKLTINNAPRALFSADPAIAAREAAQLNVGRIEVSLHDLGGFEVMLRNLAKDQQTTPEAARKSMAEAARSFAEANPEFQSLAIAVARLIEMPGSTLKVALTPKKHLQLGDAIDIGRNVPIALLSQFNIEASAGE
ncbi:MAG: hypothetical protein ACXWJT_09635 [Xanthobacteraceae bacterium]